LSQFVSDEKIVEAHLKMIADSSKHKNESEKDSVNRVISMFGPDRKMLDGAESDKNKAGEFTLSKLDPLLLSILSHRRPHAGETEEKFIASWIDTIAGMKVDGFGNRYIRIGDSPVMWSCHTDTVHTDEGYQAVHVTDDFVHLTKKERKGNRGWRACLGADDGAGIYLCIKMIEREIPGLYVFHRGEEIGGLGSGWAAVHAEPDFFEGITMAIALDRKGYDSVTTYQGPRCCSNKFAQALADQLGGEFKPDSTGLFTDTANYTSLIPECTNLSVGYFRQHGPQEVQNYKFLDALLEQLCELNIKELPIDRDVSDHDYAWDAHYGFSGSNYVSQFDRETDKRTWDRDTTYTGTQSTLAQSDENFDYDPDTNTYTHKSDRRTHEYPLREAGGMGDEYNGSEYDPMDPWDDDPNNPDQYEAAKRIEVDAQEDITEAWVTAMHRDKANEDDLVILNDPDSIENQHRFKMFKVACQEFPAMIADILYEQNVTLQEFIELDPWAAAAILMETDLDEEDLAAFIEDEIEHTSFKGDPNDDPAF